MRKPLPEHPIPNDTCLRKSICGQAANVKALDLASMMPSDKAPKITPAKMRRFLQDALERLGTGNWVGAKPSSIVALYGVCHERVYGCSPAELSNGLTYLLATAAAARQTKEEFGGDPIRAVEFMRWVWVREESREKWRRENGRDGGRISWKLQFGKALVTDYRIAMARKKSA